LAGGVKAGIPVSLSGQFLVQGRQALAGLQAWAQYVNQTGGLWVAGHHTRLPVSLVHYDDASRADLARQATHRLLRTDRVDLLFGPYSSALTEAAAAVAEEHGQVLWNQGGASQRVYQRGYRWVVGVLTPATEYLAGLLPLVREAAPEATTLAVVRASTGEFPRAVSAGVESQAAALGFHTVLELEYPPATADFSSVLDAVARARPDVLVAVGRIHHDLALARQLVSRRLPLTAAAVVAAPIQQFRDALGTDVAGFLGPSQWEESVNYAVDYGPATRQVREGLRQAGVPTADYPAAQAYAAGLVAQRCVEEAGSLEQGELRAAASSLDMTTFYGRFKIDPDTGRQAGRTVALVQWQEGQKVVVWPRWQRQGELVCPW
jgi:branched-chain amino acid transport system substrate-binding protein